MTGAHVVDGLGRTVRLAVRPERIVSLVPSTTETLAALGRGAAVVGRTRYCVHPRPWVDGVPTVGGTKSPDLARIRELRPDLVLGNQEENHPRLWDELAAIAPLYVAFPRTVDEALADLERMAGLVGADREGHALVERLRTARGETRRCATPFTYAYLVWREPWMSVNDDTFIASLLAERGGRNVFGDRNERYPRIGMQDLVTTDPDVVFLASEPFPFRAEHVDELGSLAARGRLVDGELLSWHGVRMAAAFPYLVGLDLPNGRARAATDRSA